MNANLTAKYLLWILYTIHWYQNWKALQLGVVEPSWWWWGEGAGRVVSGGRQSCSHAMACNTSTPPQSGHSSCLPTILNIILKKPHNHNLTTSVLSNGYLSSGSGSDSAANSSTEWLVLGIFSCSSDLAEGLAICPHLSLNFNVQTVSGCCPGPGRWRRWRCVTGGERRHAWLPSPPPAPLETGALQVSQYSREPIQRRCLIAPV